LHFFCHVFGLVAHEGLHTRGGGAATVVVAVVVPVAVHGEHPLQQNHEHLNDQLSELCAQKDLHSLTVVDVLVVVVAGSVVVVVAGSVVVVVAGSVVIVAVIGAGVGEEPPGMH